MTNHIFKAILIITILIHPLFSGAQDNSIVQHGIVCTSVNPANPIRKVVPGVRVVINGAMGEPTNSKGQFSRQVPFTFKVDGVDSNDYILIAPKEDKTRDRDVLEVVVITKEQKDYVTSDRFKALQKQYRKQGEEYLHTRNRLQEALDSLDAKDVKYEELKAQYEEIRSLYIKHIEDEDKITENLRKIAEELALTDFQSLDTIQHRIWELRWNGDWEGIEKFIRSTMNGSAEDEIQRIRQDKAVANEQIAEATTQMKAGLFAQKIAEQEEKDWFFKIENLIDKFKVTHENDSVSKYYNILIDAAPGKWEYLNEAGKFEEIYMARYDKAIEYFEKAKESNPVDSLVSRSCNNLGVVYYLIGDYSKAQEYYELALKINLSLFGENCIEVAGNYNNIGQIHARLGSYDEALKYYDKSCDIFQSLYGEMNSAVALSYNNIGTIFDEMNNYIKALELHEKSLNIRLTIYGENHPDVAQSYTNIGSVYDGLGDYAKALDYYEKALEIQLSVLGENHPNISTTYNKIGNVYIALGDYSKGLEYHEKALEIRLSFLGENHPDVAASYINIGGVYYSLGDYTKALEYQGKALEILLPVLGENHPDVAANYNEIGRIYFNQGNYDLALVNYEKALNVLLAVFDENDLSIAMGYNNIGNVYTVQNEFDKALKCHEKAIQIRLSLLGEKHPDIAQSYLSIGFLYACQEDYAKALEYFEKSKNMYSEFYPEDHPEILKIKELIDLLKIQRQ